MSLLAANTYLFANEKENFKYKTSNKSVKFCLGSIPIEFKWKCL